MRPVAEAELRAAMINCTRSEAARMTFPLDLRVTDWTRLDFLGWRDRKNPQRGYLVRQTDTELIGLTLRAPEATMSARKTAMCLLCRAVDTADAISLFTTRKTGPAGRNGDTVGTYICAGLDCLRQLRQSTSRRPGRTMADGHKSVDEQAVDLLHRLDAFIAAVY